ncbi:hypothetical protein A2V49_03480 [candidate division WWE3 bacterium RBG_19FT_COMBO_34_6]|uniref:Response regulatory domain-containing protein n=1 Tax=candidate division WWE3 bacterium RBG_19FT_COMBO_34_6 TaxID=1802612 RepID=A0A1F4UMB5_UNCKA|nr:MAG: hypothetical protein A2V49_03480 [candidate division WWE3 bacterium RBG_19FT_COMBO_34_6]
MARKVLIIEDEKSIRTMYADILIEEKFEVIEAGDGMRGLSLATEGEWDILLLDIMLPKLDGVELLKQLKNDPKTKDKPVIMLTNLADENIKLTCQKLGAKDFLVKSNINLSDIVSVVNTYVPADKS